MASKPASQLTRERDGTYSAGSVWLGRCVMPGVYAEQVQQDRHMVRTYSPQTGVVRIGEVFGAGRRHQAYDMNDQLIAIERSMHSAVLQLVQLHRQRTTKTASQEAQEGVTA